MLVRVSEKNISLFDQVFLSQDTSVTLASSSIGLAD